MPCQPQIFNEDLHCATACLTFNTSFQFLRKLCECLIHFLKILKFLRSRIRANRFCITVTIILSIAKLQFDILTIPICTIIINSAILRLRLNHRSERNIVDLGLQFSIIAQGLLDLELPVFSDICCPFRSRHITGMLFNDGFNSSFTVIDKRDFETMEDLFDDLHIGFISHHDLKIIFSQLFCKLIECITYSNIFTIRFQTISLEILTIIVFGYFLSKLELFLFNSTNIIEQQQRDTSHIFHFKFPIFICFIRNLIHAEITDKTTRMNCYIRIKICTNCCCSLFSHAFDTAEPVLPDILLINLFFHRFKSNIFIFYIATIDSYFLEH